MNEQNRPESIRSSFITNKCSKIKPSYPHRACWVNIIGYQSLCLLLNIGEGSTRFTWSVFFKWLAFLHRDKADVSAGACTDQPWFSRGQTVEWMSEWMNDSPSHALSCHHHNHPTPKSCEWAAWREQDGTWRAPPRSTLTCWLLLSFIVTSSDSRMSSYIHCTALCITPGSSHCLCLQRRRTLLSCWSANVKGDFLQGDF